MITELQKSTMTIKHSRERKKLLEAKMVWRNSKSILSGIFDFDSEKDLDKVLLFELKNTSEEQISDAILEKIADSDTYHIKHREGTNTFWIRKDEYENKKDKIIAVVGEISETTKKSKFSQLKWARSKLLKGYKELGEKVVKINDRKTVAY